MIHTILGCPVKSLQTSATIHELFFGINALPSLNWCCRLAMLLDVNNVGEVDAYIQGMLFDQKKIMGFGHRIYVVDDPRSRHLRKVSKSLCQRIDRMELYQKCRKIQAVVHKEKKIYPNVDFYAATVLNALDVPKEFFTLFFASSRVTGWAAHILEQYSDAVLLRPTSRYVGAYGTKFISLKNR